LTRCRDLLCGAGHTDDIIGLTMAQPGGTLVDILPTDAAVWLNEATLTKVG
jgi:hypothetical protein